MELSSDKSGVLMKRGNLSADTHTGRTPCEDAGGGEVMFCEIRNTKDWQQTSGSSEGGVEWILPTVVRRIQAC